jgi:hypothetical protein
MFIFIYKKLKKITVINHIYQIRSDPNKSVQMYKSYHSSINWPVITFQLGPSGTFVPTTINNIMSR